MAPNMALVLPQYKPVNRVVSISSQFSMHHHIVPEEGRWAYWRMRIHTCRHETVGVIDPEKHGYFILHGGTRKENLHWGRFPNIPKLYHYILQGEGHNLIVAMKQSGQMRKVLQFAIFGQEEQAVRLLTKNFKIKRRDQLPDQQKFLW